MARLPIPGSDAGNWGDILNDYLSQAHLNDGTLKPIPQSKVTGLEAALSATPSSVLTTDGDILTRAGGVPSRMTRAQLANDTAFTGRFAPIVNPRDPAFGAVLDGTTNDYTAMAAAVAYAAANKRDVLLDGTAAIGTTLSIPAGVTVYASDHSTGGLKAIGALANLVTLNADSTLRNIKLDGSSTANYLVNQTGSRSQVVGCRLTGAAYVPIHATTGGDMDIEDNWFD